MWTLLLFLWLLAQNALGCLKIRDVAIDMNGCKCPVITYATKEIIQSNNYSSYLSNRKIVNPLLTITDQCQVTVEVDGVPGDYYFMVFRDDAPPIFNHRILPNTVGKAFEPHQIACSEIEGKPEWTFFGSPIRNMSVALQQNEDSCKCQQFLTNFSVVPQANITKLYGTCDYLHIGCGSSPTYLFLSYIDLFADPNRGQASLSTYWEDQTCVNGDWYSNGVLLKDELAGITFTPRVLCVYNNGTRRLDFEPRSYQCGCRDFHYASDDIDHSQNVYGDRSIFLEIFYLDGYDYVNGSVIYASEANRCSPTLTCEAGSDMMIIFSLNYKRLYYYNGTRPSSIFCAQSVLATNEDSVRYWYVDGVMLSYPSFQCYRKKPVTTTPTPTTTRMTTVKPTTPPPCKCEMTAIDPDYDLSSIPLTNPILQNVSLYPLLLVNRGWFSCWMEIWTYGGTYIVIFDETETHLISPPDTYVNASCDPYTNKWTVSTLNESLFVIGSAYALHVNYSAVPACVCPFANVNPSNAQSIIGSNSFYQNLTSHTFEDAVISESPADLCSKTFSCNGADKTLVILTKTESFVFKEGTSLNGMCDPFGQQWIFDDGVNDMIMISEAYPTCVSYPKPTTTPTPGTIPPSCQCRRHEVTPEGFQEETGNNNPFLSNISQYPTTGPYAYPITSNCDFYYIVASNARKTDAIVVLDATNYGYFGADIIRVDLLCNPWTNEWQVTGIMDKNNVKTNLTDGPIFKTDIYGFQVNYTYREPTTTKPPTTPIPSCQCKRYEVTPEGFIELAGNNNPFLSNISQYPTTGPYAFSGTSDCELFYDVASDAAETTTIVVLDATNYGYFGADIISVFLVCNPWTSEWQVKSIINKNYVETEVTDGPIFKPVYGFQVNYTYREITTTVKPTTPAPCFCPALIGLNEDNRDQYDPDWKMDGWVVPYTLANTTVGTDICYQSTINCPDNLYVFHGGADPAVFQNQPTTLNCQRNPSGEGQWNWAGNWMTNAMIGCVKPEDSSVPCSCTPLQGISDTTRATYDPNNEMQGEINLVSPALATFAGNTLCYKASITCDTNLYIYATGNNHYVQKLSGTVLLKCMKQPGGSYEWHYGTQAIVKPAYACIV